MSEYVENSISKNRSNVRILTSTATFVAQLSRTQFDNGMSHTYTRRWGHEGPVEKIVGNNTYVLLTK